MVQSRKKLNKEKEIENLISSPFYNHDQIIDVYYKPTKNNKNKKYKYVKANCKKHGVYEKTVDAFKKGAICPQCSIDKRTKRTVVKNFYKVKNSNDILLDVFKKNKRWYLLLECQQHHIIYTQRNDNYKQGYRCQKCQEEKTLKRKKEENIKYFKQIESRDKFIDTFCAKDGSNFNRWYGIFKCKKHGEYKIYKGNCRNNKINCPKCNISLGEEKIKNVLNDMSINYYEQYQFDNCKNTRPLRFDFYLPNQNICIEYDGEQHYRPVDFFGGEKGFLSRQENDKIKNKYCKENNINLVRIPYTDFNNIEEILKTNIKR